MNRKSIIILSLAFFCSLVLPCLGLCTIECIKSLYIDGQFITNFVTGEVLEFTAGEIRIASEGPDIYLYNEYIGAMDEFAIYGEVLDISKISAHYNASDSNVNYTGAVSADNPLLWLRFEDANMLDGAVAVNSGSSPTQGQYLVKGAVSPLSQVTGINAQSSALYIPDSDITTAGHQVNVPDNGEFGESLEGNVTIELWINFTAFNSMPGNDYPKLFTTGGAYGLNFGNEPNMLLIHGGGKMNSVTLAENLNDGQWHHIVVTYETVTICPSKSYAEIIASGNPVLWLRFENQDPCDYSGNNNWVDYGSAASIVSGVGSIGNCVRLDGLSGPNHFSVAAAKGPNAPQPPYQDFSDDYAFAPGDITFEMWFKSFPQDQQQPDVNAFFFQQHGPSVNENAAPAVGVASDEIRVSGGSGLGYTGVNPLFDAKWHHLVVTYDENFNDVTDNLMVTIYLDGNQEYNQLFTATGSHLGPELSHILIGAENDLGETYNAFAGYVDEFAIYDRILNYPTIYVHYEAWQPKSCAEVIERGLAPQISLIDTNQDCIINLFDLATIADNWLLCTDPRRFNMDPDCVPVW
ncbi:MAG: LamG-like jellyroll fold domain-containing protein [Phycisphaerae bacterium]|jgi:hypothetical protein